MGLPYLGNILAGNNSELVDRLVHDQHLLLEEIEKYKKITAFLSAVARIKENAEQRIAYGLPVEPMPVPPPGYTLPLEVGHNPTPAMRTNIGTPTPHVYEGKRTYSGIGDDNPAGTRMANPHEMGRIVVKVVQQTPFGSSHFWIDE